MKRYLLLLALLTPISSAFALNQTGDWQFTNNTNWVYPNAGLHTATCGGTTSTTDTAYSVFARDATNVISLRSNNATKSASIVQGGNANQTIIATSSGSVNYKGRFDFSSSVGGAGAFGNPAWARVDLYDSTNTNWVGLIGCSAFTAATATTTVVSTQPVVLTGGTTYTVRLSTSLKSVNTTGTSNNIYMDKIVVTAPPINVQGSLSGQNINLTWDTSTATTSANGLAAANGYSIYRGASSGAETAYASSTTGSYTDSSPLAGVTNYYWITNTDTAGVESASSTEISVAGPSATVRFIEPGGDATFNVATRDSGGFWGQTSAGTALATDIVHGAHIKSIKYRPNTSDSVRTNANGGGFLKDSGSRISVYVYLVALPNATETIAGINDSTGNTVYTIRLTSAGALQLWQGSNTSQIGSNGATLSTGRWYRLGFSYYVGSKTVNNAVVFVDSSSSISVINTSLTLNGVDSLTIGNIDVDTTLDFRSSDLYIDNSSAVTDPGNIWVTAKRPNANGTTNGFGTQIGSGGSGYGTGHSPQVNERPLSTTNGWSMIGAGSAVTEEYNVESAATGDIDISKGTLVGYEGWVSAKSLAGETAQLVLNGVNTPVALTSTATMFFGTTTTATYPAGTGTDIGLTTDTSLTTVSLYEAGIVVAYIPAVIASAFQLWTFSLF